jgi:hypothetical protein
VELLTGLRLAGSQGPPTRRQHGHYCPEHLLESGKDRRFRSISLWAETFWRPATGRATGKRPAAWSRAIDAETWSSLLLAAKTPNALDCRSVGARRLTRRKRGRTRCGQGSKPRLVYEPVYKRQQEGLFRNRKRPLTC